MRGRQFALRTIAAILLLSGLILLVPRLMPAAGPDPIIGFHDAPLNQVLDAVADRTGVRAVAMPELAARKVDATIDTRKAGAEIVADLAKNLGLGLTQAGPHLVITDPPQRAQTL